MADTPTGTPEAAPAEETPPPRKPAGPFWWAAFVLAHVAFIGAVFGLVALSVQAVASGGEPAPNPPPREGTAEPGASPSPAGPRSVLYYAGEPTFVIATSALQPATADHPPDLVFERVASGGTVTKYYVPVVSFHAGVYEVTREQLDGLLTGSATPASLGGVGNAIRYLAVVGDVNAIARFAIPPAETVESYDALRALAADVNGTPIVSFVPFQELRPQFATLAVNGIDLVRGTGDTTAWPFTEGFTTTALTELGRKNEQALAATVMARLPQVTRVVATGDILMSRCTLTRIRATGDWASPLRSEVGEFLAGATLALTSFDASIQDIGAPYECVSTTNLTSPPEVLEALQLAGIDEGTVATNHAADCGQAFCGMRALLRSIELINGAGIKTVGGGANLEEALAPAIFEVGGIRIGILGFDDIAAEDLEATADGPGTAPLDDSYANEKADPPAEPAFYKSADLLGVTRLQERIRALKADVDIVIVQIQSGTEDTHTPSPRSIKALRAAAEAGADLVVGNQAHWVQAAELRGDTFVAYALGNFIFDQVHTPEHTQGYLLEAVIAGKTVLTVRLWPYQIEQQYRPAFVSDATRAKILGDVFAASQALPD